MFQFHILFFHYFADLKYLLYVQILTFYFYFYCFYFYLRSQFHWYQPLSHLFLPFQQSPNLKCLKGLCLNLCLLLISICLMPLICLLSQMKICCFIFIFCFCFFSTFGDLFFCILPNCEIANLRKTNKKWKTSLFVFIDVFTSNNSSLVLYVITVSQTMQYHTICTHFTKKIKKN